MNWKAISRNVGIALLVSALFMFLSILISLAEGRDSACAALIISFTITFIVGAFPFIFVRKAPAISMKEGFVIITLSWLLSFIFGMLPYAMYGGQFTLANAWFESVSGFTTSGATILTNVEALPKSLLFWRSSTHFIGGLGVVVFLLLIIPNSSPVKLRLTNLELSSLSRNGYSSRVNKNVYIFAYVYLAICGLAFVTYMLAGMSPFDAICHAMSVCATGGFSTKNASIGAFNSRWIEGLTMLYMYVASIHFGLLYFSVINRSFKPLNNPVVKFYTLCLLIFTVVVGIGLKAGGFCPSWQESMWSSAFQVLCVATTSGFGILDNADWPIALNTIMMVLAVMCGCAGSTSGGLKADRVLLMFKTIGRQINRALHPSSVNEVHMGNAVIRSEDLAPQLMYALMYFMLITLSVILTLLAGVDTQNAFAASITSVSNVGPALGTMGTMGNFNEVSIAAKFIFTMDMFLGRVEIYPVLTVVAMIFGRRTR